MRQPKLLDYLLLILLALIWASAFFNIKIATYSFGPITIAFKLFQKIGIGSQ